MTVKVEFDGELPFPVEFAEFMVASSMPKDAVKYTPQSPTPEQQAQARQNIGVPELVQETGDSETVVMSQAAVTKEVNSLSEKISNVETELLILGDAEIPLDIQTDGYYGTNGVFYETTGRLYAIVDDVDADSTYKLTTRLSSTLIAGALYLDESNTVIGYELLGTGTAETIEKYTLTIPAGCKTMIIQSASGSYPLELYVVKFVKNSNAVEFVGEITVRLNADLIEKSNVLASGFSGDKTIGFTHTAEVSGVLQFYNANITAGDYILEFDTDYTAGEFVRCGFANDYKNYAYNGGQHIIMPIRNTDGSLYLFIESVYNGSYTLSNIKLRKINAHGTEEVTLTINSAICGNNQNNLGFWNVLLGFNTMNDAVGSTRSIAIGYSALGRLKGGHRNIGIGTFAMSQMTGGEGNVSIGADSMLGVKESYHNVAIGREACYSGTKLQENVAIGHSALFGGTDSEANYNVAVGACAGYKCTSHRGVFVGHQAGYNVKGYGNTMVGFNTLGNADGYDNTCIGKQATFNNGIHNATSIGANAVCKKSNQVALGDSNVTSFIFGNKEIVFNDDGSVTWTAV